jgi:hypothetical protein
MRHDSKKVEALLLKMKLKMKMKKKLKMKPMAVFPPSSARSLSVSNLLYVEFSHLKMLY